MTSPTLLMASIRPPLAAMLTGQIRSVIPATNRGGEKRAHLRITLEQIADTTLSALCGGRSAQLDSSRGRFWARSPIGTLSPGHPFCFPADAAPAHRLDPAQVGLFATSPTYLQTSASEASISGGPSTATGVFDHVGLTWRGRRRHDRAGPRRHVRGAYRAGRRGRDDHHGRVPAVPVRRHAHGVAASWPGAGRQGRWWSARSRSRPAWPAPRSPWCSVRGSCAATARTCTR
jgi:hypothetical protein